MAKTQKEAAPKKGESRTRVTVYKPSQRKKVLPAGTKDFPVTKDEAPTPQPSIVEAQIAAAQQTVIQLNKLAEGAQEKVKDLADAVARAEMLVEEKAKWIEDKVKEAIQNAQKTALSVKHFFTSKPVLWLIGFFLAVIIALVLFFTVFHKPKPVEQSPQYTNYADKIARIDSTLKWQQKYIDELNWFKVNHDSLIQQNNRLYRQGVLKELEQMLRYDKIPDNVRAMDRELIRRELSKP